MVLIATVTVAILMLLPASAAADGLPAVGIDARPLSVPGGQLEYTTERAGRSTRLIEGARYGGNLRVRRLEGVFSIPAVAYDGSPSGLSADGRTLVLINPRTRIPRERTTFAIVDAKSLRVRRRIRLDGDFSFDAISPDGRLVYLIHYLTPRDVTDYAVRAYDLRARRLLPEPIVDPSEPDEDMSGIPVTRVAGTSGRWAYTLYDGGRHPFVHALDTERLTAVCIDLHDLGEVWGAKLDLRGPRLEVVDGAGFVLASIDTRTHRVVEKKPAPPTDDADTSWLPIAAPTAALLLLAAFTRRRLTLRRRQPGPITEEWEASSDRHAPTA
jgi:hypothetical protein